jgi:hypothetical protein
MMTKEERKEYKAIWAKQLGRLAAEDPVFAAKLQSVRNRLNKKNEDTFESIDEYNDTLKQIMDTDPYWTGLDAKYRTRLMLEADVRTEGTFIAGVDTTRSMLEYEATRMGFTLSQEQIADMSRQAFLEDWEATEVREHLLPLAELVLGEGNVGGDLGKFATQLKDWSNLNGINMSQTAIDQYVYALTAGEKQMDQVKQEIRNMYMAGKYPGWSDPIGNGKDINTLADPYRGLTEKMLGKPDMSVDDPTMQRIMSVQNADGTFRARTLHEAEKEIRQLDEWQYSPDGRETYVSAANTIAKLFGYA